MPVPNTIKLTDPDDPEVSEASFDTERSVLFIRLSDGRRLFIPREELTELKNATNEQAAELFIVPSKTGIWWPQIDDGIYLPTFLERRWHKSSSTVAEPIAA